MRNIVLWSNTWFLNNSNNFIEKVDCMGVLELDVTLKCIWNEILALRFFKVL